MTQTLSETALSETAERRLAIEEAAARVITDPENSRLAARLLAA
nr:hypothetical protein GCM10020093_035090 [Planobispora longispora]